MVVLEYGDPASLEYIASIADDIAAVIVEPIQSRNPELQPTEFVQSLRELTRAREVPLIFDEIITGFRLHPKGAQAWYGVDADICAYGKVVGGGMPIGVVAGKSEFMDALDGGQWEYGDDSFPEAGVTYFAGTFVRHPSALAAVNAAMTRLKEAGPSLQAGLNRRTSIFCERVNRAYHEAGVPIELTYFSSVILPRFRGNPDYEGLYYQHLRHQGVHIWEGRPGFFSTEHGDEEFSTLFDGFVQAAHELQQAGFLPAPSADGAAPERYAWTPAQSELWLALAMGQEARSAYNEQVLFDLAGPVDTEVLELSFDKVVNRHSSLRARVADDELGIEICHYMQPEFSVVDLTTLPPPERGAKALALAQDNIDRNFDLKNGPLVRLLVLKKSTGQYWLCLAASHLICDGWSLEIILQDLCHFYNAMAEGRQVDRGTPPSLDQFQQALGDIHSPEEVEEAKQYWLSEYSPAPAPAALPFDFPRPPLKTYQGERTAYSIGAETADQLRQFAKEQGCTLFVVTLAAFQFLMHKLGRSDDVVVGIPAAGQPAVGMMDLVTHDVSFLPLRGRLQQTETLLTFLERVRASFNAAQEFQCFAYGDLLQHIDLPRDPSRIPLITSSFNMDQEMTPAVFGDAKAEFLTTPRGFVKYDLFFNLMDLGEGRGLELEVDHNTDLLTQTKALSWSNQYTELLAKLPTLSVDTPMADITLTPGSSKVDTHRLAGKDVAEFVQGQTLVSLFETAVDTHSSRIALVEGSQEVSYAELDKQANQLANWLLTQGVQPGGRVALLAERSVQMLVSIYAVIKAGAAYLPLDPDHPDQRLAEIVANAGVRLMLCDQAVESRIKKALADNVQVVAADAQDAEWRGAEVERPLAAAPKASDLAYVIYTSGSTGKPKGVMIEHKAICNRFLWGQSELPIHAEDVVLLKTPYTFDVSLWELFWPLQVGAKLVIAKPGGHGDARYLHQLLEEQQVTLAHFVPSMLTQFLAHPTPATLKQLRRVYCTGEALTGAHQESFFAAYPHSELYNMYGPTEAAVEIMYWRCEAGSDVDEVPIGYPMDNCQLYVLDDNLDPVTPGTTGELYLAGDQLARGYLNAPEQTAEVFFDHEFSDLGSVRLYRTGDLVRELDGGILVYLGRTDSQVKLRGFRIELGEIETKLLSQPSVANVAVLVQQMGANDDRLVAYLVAAPGESISELTLRRELTTLLPHYMVPQHFVELAEMPLTSSGKVDRNELLAAYATQSGPGQIQEPSTEEERIIADIWIKALKIEQVSTDAYFFEVGGHSLLAMAVGREIETRLGKRFDLQEMLLNNLAQLAVAAASAKGQDAANDSSQVEARNRGRRGGLLGKLLD